MNESKGTLQQKRFLGLELAGAKNQKTALAVLEYYPREQKTFLLEIYDRITAQGDETGDQALLDTIHAATEGRGKISQMGVNVPLTLPPCIGCDKRACQKEPFCAQPSVKWMRKLREEALELTDLPVNVLEFTPYTQRPFELWARYALLPSLPKEFRFEIDEALGGNKAPLTARMHFLSRHLRKIPCVEVWPKLTVALLAQAYGLPKRFIHSYRKLEEGYQSRLDLLEAIAIRRGIFIYERDLKKLAQSLTAFDSFVCAYTALLAERDLTTRPPKGFPVESGWVQYPAIQNAVFKRPPSPLGMSSGGTH